MRQGEGECVMVVFICYLFALTSDLILTYLEQYTPPINLHLNVVGIVWPSNPGSCVVGRNGPWWGPQSKVAPEG